MAGLFSTLNIGTSGMSAQQKAIDVTSHNIANANTEGYTRQRAVIESNTPYDMPSVNNAISGGQVGTGAAVTAVQRVRDDFLDYQVRAETSTKGTYETRDNYLSQVESIFNEPSDTGISSLMGKFFNSWQDLSTQPQDSNERTVVAQQSAALADALNHSYNQLQSLKADSQSFLKEQVIQVNDYLDQIDKLNQQIMSVKIAGSEPNDLMDKRDLLLDKLSSDFNITIDKKNYDGINLKARNSDGISNASLVQSENSDDVKRFSYISGIEQVGDSNEYKITYYKNGDMTNDANKVEVYVANIDADKLKQLDENRVLWANKDGLAIGLSADESGALNLHGKSQYDPVDTSQIKLFNPDSGQLKGAMSVQQDIDNYTDQLNKMAKALAFTVNAIQSGRTSVGNPQNPLGNPPDADYMPFFVNSDSALYDTDSDGKDTLNNLGQTLNNEVNITAGNISVNREILDDPMKIKTNTHDDEFAYASENDVDGNGDGKRALAIAQLRDKIITIQNINSSTLRSDFITTLSSDDNGVGTIQNSANGMTMDSYYKDTVDKLGVQEQQAQRVVQNQTSLLQNFQQSRASVSGVSIDEEMANLIQYQHAYQANAKIISTVDQLLDVVINGLIK
ncbi:flagellar hook-associated protein FlgK [Clostridium pasteurianum]|uniref:Flagellar hook-associated protein 1 n=1 Tax=Clostridium pasteurianum BC1 TaxID=86416 RepID=R4K3T8_CLOPA|nr:flagellar hook-associated protein FlgK [Clostridium pasteurianum]AGK97797.1 flagellar hook-associated protein FlgK [Clostridium pasteurianum BC1]